MADISKITLPDNSQYDIKVYTDHVAPMMSKTFTGVIGTAANWANATFFYGKILPTSWTDLYRITYKVTAECAGRNDAKGIYICTLSGRANSLISYANWNSIISTSYRPIYQTTIYRAKEAGITNNYGHLLGTRLYSAWNYTTVANSRTVQIDIIRTENCSFEFFDEPVKYSEAPGTGSTNYDNYTDMNATDQGLQETGDANSYMHAGHIRYYSNLQAGETLPINSIVVIKSDGKAYKAEANKTFDIRYPIIWNDIAISNLTNYYYQYYYTQIYDRNLNTCYPGFTATAGANIYLVIALDGTEATIDSTFLTENLPTTDDGKVYIRIGRLAPNSTNGQSQFIFLQEKPMFWYKDGKVQLYSGASDYASDSGTVNGHTVAKDVPSNAVFTDTTYDDATTSAHGLMTAAMVTKLNGIDTGADVNQNAFSNVKVGSTTIAADTTTDTLELVAGSNVTITPDATNDKVTIAATDTTYSSKAAASGGTDVSLVTTGEKYTWNQKTSNVGTLTGINMNGASKGTSGVVDLGHVVTGNARVFYGTCSTAAGTVEKDVTCAEFTSADLVPGTIISVKFDNKNTGAVASLTLDVNSTGAKSIKYIYNGSYSNIPSAGYINTNHLYQFTYDGTYWVLQMMYNTIDNTRYVQYYSNLTAGPHGIPMYGLFMQLPNGTYEAFTTDSGTGTSKTKNTNGFIPNKIYYNWNSKNIAANANAPNNCVCEASYLVDLRYSGNQGSTLTAHKPVYLVGTITNGLFYLADNWITQTTPTSEDGKIYYYLGIAYDTYRADFDAYNPAYAYQNGVFTTYVGDAETVNGHTVAKDVPSNAVFTDNNTTYTFASGTNGFTVTPSGGTAQTVTVAPSNSWEIDFNGSATASVPGQDIQDMRSAYAGGSEIFVRGYGITITDAGINNAAFDFHMTTVGQTGTFGLVGTAVDSDVNTTVTFLTLTITPNALSTAAGSASVEVIGDSNTTYTFANGTNGFTVTPSGGSAQTVTVTPNISNNITGSGTRTSGYLAKFSEANKITNGPQIGSSTTTYLRNDGSWATPHDTTYDAVTYNANGLSRADMYRRMYNLDSDGNQRGSDHSSGDYSWRVYMTDSNGAPSWRSNAADYSHGGLFGVGQYRTLYNFNADGTRTNTSRHFYGINASGTPGWYDYTATDSLPGWMSADDKAKLDAINVPNIVAGTKSSVANSTRTTIASYKTTVAGTFFVFGTLTYTGTVTSGALRAVINTTTGGWGQCFSQVATTSKGATVTCFYAYEAAANTTFYLLGSQTTGAAVDLLYNFGVIRLA